jgi:hypothetical protein
MTDDQFLSQFNSRQDLVDNSGPNRNVAAENDIGQQLTNKANDTVDKIDFNAQKAKAVMDETQQPVFDAEVTRTKDIYNKISQKAYNLNVPTELRNQYAALARMAEERILDRDGGLY